MAKKKEAKNANPIVNKRSLAFFEKYVNNASPVSYESSGQQLWLDYLKPFVDTHYVDNYGSAVGIINPEADYKVVIEAHADEISWYVNYIPSEGNRKSKRLNSSH